jgi:hypothetical protein
MQGWEGGQREVQSEDWAPETIGVGEATVGEAVAGVVAALADRFALIALTGQLIHPIFGDGGRLTG